MSLALPLGLNDVLSVGQGGVLFSFQSISEAGISSRGLIGIIAFEKQHSFSKRSRCHSYRRQHCPQKCHNGMPGARHESSAILVHGRLARSNPQVAQRHRGCGHKILFEVRELYSIRHLVKSAVIARFIAEP